MKLRFTALLGIVVMALTALTACSDGGTDGTALSLQGAVDRPADLTYAEIKARPATTQTITFGSGPSAQTHTYTGASTWTLLTDAGIVVDPAIKGDLLNRYLVATGSDGYSAVFSLGELNPAFGNKASIVAYDETISNASVPLPLQDGPLRITAPGDLRGGRYVSNLVRLSVQVPPSEPIGQVAGAATGVTITGAVGQPRRFDAAALQVLPATSVSVGGASYTGVSLWTLLKDTVGLAPADPKARNPQLRMVAQATGIDGYKALVAVGEIDPGYGNRAAILAYSVDGQPLDRSGPIRLVVGGDGRQGRSVSNLESIQVFSAN